MRGNRNITRAQESTTGWDISPKLFGKIKFTELRSNKHLQMIRAELQTRQAMPALGGGGFRVLVDALQRNG
jgi:hypothetical protein